MYIQQSAMNDFLKELQDLGGKVFTTSRTPMSQSDDDLIEDIKNDPNRIVIKETIKSPQFGHFSEFPPHKGNDYEEVMVGGFKSLHKCSFINTSPNKELFNPTSRFNRKSNTKKLKKEEKRMKKNPSVWYHMEGEQSGIIHICYWIESLSCFVMWRHIPKNISENIISTYHNESI